MSEIILVIGFFLLVFVVKGFKVVPQQQAWIIERLGKFDRVLEPGLSLIIPFIDYVAYKHTLKEMPVDVNEQTAITQDNVSILIDGVLYLRVIDPKSASYGVSDPIYAITQLAQTTMRSEIGKMPMDKTFEEREALNVSIVNTINEAAASWGIQCMRYEIKDINPPQTVLEAMELQVAAERQKRAEILDSEGKKQSQINIAEAGKQQVVLESEAAYEDQVNRARGESEAILMVAKATAEGIDKISNSLVKDGADKAVAMQVAEKYVEAFSNLAKEGNTILLPASANDAASIVSQALTIYDSISVNNAKKNKS